MTVWEMIRWFVLPTFTISTGLWFVVTTIRLRRDQAIALSLIDVKSSRNGMKALVDSIQADALSSRKIDEDIQAVVRRTDRLLCVWAKHWGEPPELVKAELQRAVHPEKVDVT